MTPVQMDQLREYRETHVIRVVKDWDDDIRRGYLLRCEHDSIRVIRRRNGYRHDPDEIRTLARAERGG